MPQHEGAWRCLRCSRTTRQLPRLAGKEPPWRPAPSHLAACGTKLLAFTGCSAAASGRRRPHLPHATVTSLHQEQPLGDSHCVLDVTPNRRFSANPARLQQAPHRCLPKGLGSSQERPTPTRHPPRPCSSGRHTGSGNSLWIFPGCQVSSCKTPGLSHSCGSHLSSPWQVSPEDGEVGPGQ